ncbi:MAG: hypothetical protein H7326_02525 [Bdellovibrionaceae bacterium]|nr:hypothetical protein [Pseudobdellovibrionaceae bacterium]
MVVLAENHGSPSALSFPQILYSIKKTNPETDCLFVEYPDSFGQKLKELQEQQKLPFDSQENIGLMISQNQILAADKIGLKVIPIDNHPTRIDQVKSLSKQGFRDRNLVMANAIDKNFENGTCKAGILIVGAFHWTKGGASKEVPSLKDLVKAKTASILIVNTACHPTMPAHNDPIWKWSECKNNPPIIEAEAIVETSSLSDDVNLVPSGGRWNDFDIGLITPAAYDSNCLRVR